MVTLLAPAMPIPVAAKAAPRQGRRLGRQRQRRPNHTQFLGLREAIVYGRSRDGHSAFVADAARNFPRPDQFEGHWCRRHWRERLSPPDFDADRTSSHEPLVSSPYTIRPSRQRGGRPVSMRVRPHGGPQAGRRWQIDLNRRALDGVAIVTLYPTAQESPRGQDQFDRSQLGWDAIDNDLHQDRSNESPCLGP